MRYAVKAEGDNRRVHFVENDEVQNAFCGVRVSTDLRFSRRAVSRIRKLETCQNCVTILIARKKREAR